MLWAMMMIQTLASEVYHLPGFHEPFCAISHLFGALLFLVLGIVIFRRGRGDAGRMTSLGIYGFSAVFLMSMSGVYHMMVRGGTAHGVMARLDHSAIFVLIAGTFTPVHVILFKGWRRWLPLTVIWTAAITGLTLKTIFFTSVPEWFGLGLYLLMGWFGAFSGFLVVQRYGWAIVKPLAWGGLAYSIGGIVDFLDWPVVISGVIEGHEVFHVAVLLGAIWHWRFTAQFAGGAPVATGGPETENESFAEALLHPVP
jgi:channel protein (hemolysin III family)